MVLMYLIMRYLNMGMFRFFSVDNKARLSQVNVVKALSEV